MSRDVMISPGGVAVLLQADGRETVFVADVPCLRGFDSRTGDPVYRERSIPGGSLIVWPLTVAPDEQNLVITSWFQNGVQVWDVAGHTVLENYNDFVVPLNAIRFMGDLVVAELGTGRVVRIDAETKERTTLAKLAIPTGLAATEDDVWVGDWDSGSVFQVVRDGNLLPQPEPVAANLSSPEGLAVAPDGSLLVVESSAARLSHIDLEIGSVTTIAEGLELGKQGQASVPPTNIFNGVAVSPSGVIYVTGDKENILYRIELRH